MSRATSIEIVVPETERISLKSPEDKTPVPGDRSAEELPNLYSLLGNGIHGDNPADAAESA